MVGKHILQSRRSRRSSARKWPSPPPFLARLSRLHEGLNKTNPLLDYLRATAVNHTSIIKSLEAVLGRSRGWRKGVKAAHWGHATQIWWGCWGSTGGRRPAGSTRRPRWLGCRHPRGCGCLHRRWPSGCRGPSRDGLSCCPLGIRCPISITFGAGAYMSPSGLIHL